MEERRNFEAELKRKINEQKRIVKTWQLLSLKWEEERNMLIERSDMLNEVRIAKCFS